MVNIEGIYRPLPKDDREFDPEKHEKTLHKKRPLKGKETWIRKSALQNDRKAELIAERSGEKKQSWFKKLFGIKKEPYLDVLTEQGLNEYIQRSNFTFEEKKEGSKFGWVSGIINGHKLEMDTNVAQNPYNTYYNQKNFFIDGEKISEDDAEKIAEKILRLLVQWSINKNQTEKLGAEAKTELSEKDRAVLEVLGKLPPKEAPELEQAGELKQLGPKTEE